MNTSAADLADLPLVVDMDGTLVRTDTLHEGVLTLLRQQPLALMQLPSWLRRGRAAFKAEIAERVQLDAALLPYNETLLARLRREAGRRPLVLCTAADARFAKCVADHVGLFDEVLASSHAHNLKGEAKAAELSARFGAAGFDYAGDDVADLPVFAAARNAWVVAPSPGLRARESEVRNLSERFIEPAVPRLRSIGQAMRLHQWVKNVLVFVPLLATFEVATLAGAGRALVAFVAFSLTASSVYLLNDMLDVSADRRHPRKRSRPFAAGRLAIVDGLKLVPLLLLAGFAIAVSIAPLFALVLGIYWVCTSLYTFWLKRVPLLDTLLLAGLYTLRIIGGAAAIVVIPSFWLLAFSMFFFLSLAMAKRHSELVELEGTDAQGSIPGREYRPEDLTTLLSQGSASGYAAVLVLALYINSEAIRAQYTHPWIVWFICPLLLYWINKLWLNSQRREIEDDPLIWAVTNRVSRAIAALCIALLLLAKLAP